MLGLFSGIGIFMGIVAIIQLIIGEFEAFLGLIFSGAIFYGLGWAGRMIIMPRDKDAPPDVGKIAGVIFGGVGLIIVLSSILFFIDADLEAGFFMFIFGSVFCGAGYLAYRVFKVPEGKKAVLINERIQSMRGMLGQRTSHQYVYVDESIPGQNIEQMQEKWSDKPWTQRKDWAEGKAIQSGARNIGILIVFTIMWNLIAGGIATFTMVSEWSSGDIPWFILIFPVFGIILIIGTIRTWIRRKKYGIGVLKLDQVPAWIGDRLKGVIETGVSADKQPEGGFRMRLVCVERSSYRDSDGDKKVREKELWREEQQVYGSVSIKDFTFALTVYFNIPDNLPPTKLIPADDRTLWRVEASASTPGVDYAAKFEVPVFAQRSS